MVEIGIQINGILIVTINVKKDASEQEVFNEVLNEAFKNNEIANALTGKQIIKKIFFQNTIYYLVVK